MTSEASPRVLSLILIKVTIGGPMIKRVTDDAREDEMEENLGQVSN